METKVNETRTMAARQQGGDQRHGDRVRQVLDQCQEQMREAGLSTIWY